MLTIKGIVRILQEHGIEYEVMVSAKGFYVSVVNDETKFYANEITVTQLKNWLGY